MDRMQAYHDFWSSFGLNAYEETSVPTGDQRPALPYITYFAMTGEIGSELYPTASLWYKGTGWTDIIQKSEDIYDAIGYGGIIIPYDNGAMWIKRGSPFSQRMSDTDSLVRRVLINLRLEFLTE